MPFEACLTAAIPVREFHGWLVTVSAHHRRGIVRNVTATILKWLGGVGTTRVTLHATGWSLVERVGFVNTPCAMGKGCRQVRG